MTNWKFLRTWCGRVHRFFEIHGKVQKISKKNFLVFKTSKTNVFSSILFPLKSGRIKKIRVFIVLIRGYLSAFIFFLNWPLFNFWRNWRQQRKTSEISWPVDMRQWIYDCQFLVYFFDQVPPFLNWQYVTTRCITKAKWQKTCSSVIMVLKFSCRGYKIKKIFA